MLLAGCSKIRRKWRGVPESAQGLDSLARELACCTRRKVRELVYPPAEAQGELVWAHEGVQALFVASGALNVSFW